MRVRKKILVFCHDASLYGASRSLLDLLCGIIKEPSIALLVLVPEDGPFVQNLRALDIPYKIIYYPKNVSFNKIHRKSLLIFYRRLRMYRSVFNKLHKHVKDFNPDIIYTNTSVIYWGAIISLFSLKKHVWHIREMKDAYNIQHDFGIPFFLFLLKRSHRIICNSTAVAKDYGIYNYKKAYVVYNGLPSDPKTTSTFDEKTKATENSLIIGVIGAIHPLKGQLNVMKTLHEWNSKKDKDYKLYIIGGINDLNYFHELENFIKNNQCNSQVKFTGFVENANCYYNELDIVISGSISEAFGRVIVESMKKKCVCHSKKYRRYF
jgi:glycosyltransferase involved in cell wall biosynthesis